jgi:hypothetical protein
MTKKNKTTKTKKSRAEQLDFLLLTQFRNKLVNPSKPTIEELKEGSELRGFNELPISDLRLVTEMMGGLALVSARRKEKPSRIQCLNYIRTQFQDECETQMSREEGHDMFSSKDERHDDPNDPSSEDSESEDDTDEFSRRRAFVECLKVVMN